ncbi:ATP-dependent Clp protease ATP-binding subunit ClpE [Alkalibacterium putridalgicola]|uniref:ATP-dependent Clp protease ATP-binding subunit ClpE n=1 Tax=Alkalibacterium putridalgicola TaxID=426703 RepID=A0A1H7SVR7_9LACT|nr:ATP-dependent Clp protease ATP-binding subunit [Alkalibacterium putridalgicola]SEL76671.1 ATP-dependent Clp protease ATP-binding subunit ClpE [Alkalibacterium putridalgicola]
MICQRCMERPATIHLTTSVNGRRREIDLCQKCYREIKQQEQQGRLNQGNSQDPFGFNQFDDLFRALSQNQNPNTERPTPPNRQFSGNNQQPPINGGGRGGLLGEYGVDLTQMAKDGKIDPVIGRDKEIERVIEILNRRTKNNPVLTGEAGVGKTAIVEGLAMKIVNDEVPHKLQDKEVIRLDVASLVQGTGIRGQFEERMQQLMNELKDNDNIILFIDEVHEIVGAGSAEGSSMDAGNILKPALARGELQMVGATTLNEYRKIEKDPALERRLQPVRVNEPTIEETLTILKGIQKQYEDYHHVKYSDKAIKSAVELSHRYIQDRFLPDKAIDLLDESGSKKNLTIQSVDPKSLEEKIDEAEKQKQESLEKEDYEKAAFYRDQVTKYKEMIEQQTPQSEQPEVTEQDIINIIEIKTGIPVGELKEKEQAQLKDLDKALRHHVIGQDEAVDKVAKAIRRNRIGLRQKNRPIGSFMFVGPTGVGKTELAKTLALELFGSKDAYVRLDMSEYMEKHSTSKLIGSPPGYVGYDEAGQLTEKVRRNPYSLILVDEVEKAHPDVLHMFLQILDDGRLTDAQGRTVNFKETIIIMTSNAGTTNVESSVGFGAQISGEQHSIKNRLQDYFRPELLNRFDGIVEFHPLSKENLLEIVDLMLEDVNEALKQHDITVHVDQSAKEKLVDLGYDPKMGARPLRRVIEEHIEDKIAEFYINNPEPGKISATVEDDAIVITKKSKEQSSNGESQKANEETNKTDSTEQ